MRRMGGRVESRTPRYDAVASRGSSTATTPRSSALRMSRPAPCASSVAARGRSTREKARAAGPVAPRLEQRVVGSGEGEAVDRHQRQGAARDVDPLPEAERGEEARGLVPGELLEQPALGEVALEQERVGELGRQRLAPPPRWPAGW